MALNEIRKNRESVQLISYSELILAINDVTKTETLGELNEMLDAHLESGIFGFKYYTLALVDQLKERIRYWHGKSISKSINMSIWKGKIDYDLRKKNILSFVVKERKPVSVSLMDVYILNKGTKQKLSKARKKEIDIIFNEDVFRNNKILKKCKRIFFPIIYHSKDNSQDTVLGVIQFGFVKDELLLYLDQAKIQRIQLYIDNVAQKLISLQKEEWEFQFINFFDQTFEKFQKAPNGLDEFLLTCSENLMNKLDCKATRIVFYNDLHDPYLLKSFFKSKKKISVSKFHDSIKIASKKLQIKTFGSLELLDRTKSFSGLILKIFSGDAWIGFLEFRTDQLNWFNNLKHSFLLSYIKEMGLYHKKLKFSILTSKLAIPLNQAVNPLPSSELPFIEFLTNHFSSSFVTIWYKTEKLNNKKYNSNKTLVSRSYMSQAFEKICSKSKKDVLQLDFFEMKTLNSKNDNKNFENFITFSRQNNFEEAILIPLLLHGDFVGLIAVYSRFGLYHPSPIDKGIVAMISSKFIAYESNRRYVESLIQIGESIKEQSIDNVFQKIANKSISALNCDIAFCYKVEDSGIVRYKDGYLSGKFIVEGVDDYYYQNRENRIPLIENIIKEKESRWLKDPTNISTFFLAFEDSWDSEKFKKRFWEREEIESCAVVQLKDSNDKIIALMVLNFRKSQMFDDTQKSSIQLFASSMANALSKDIAINNVSGQRDRALIAVDELIPLATRTSFYLILEGINHEIKNLLFKMSSSLFRIEDNIRRLPKNDKIIVNKTVHEIELSAEMVENLLGLFDFKQKEKKFYDLNLIIQEVVNFFKQTGYENIEFNLNHLDSKIDFLLCYKVELSMIFYNLIRNAINAIEDMPIIKNKTIKISTELSKNCYIITVKDNGIGIDRSRIDKIFDRSYSWRKDSEKNGTGIGLYFVKLILEQNYFGEISCNSNKNGTEFRLIIPYKANFLQ